MQVRRIDKVIAYVVCGDRLLVFDHPLHPEVGVQVPGGTVEVGEPLDSAVLRELREETGLSRFAEPQYLGQAEFSMEAWGRAEVHRRHFFKVELKQETPATWRNLETSGGTAPAEVFAFRWVPLNAVPDLAAGQGALLHEVSAG
jgi:8-oxo-dGTP pyrophosphatase MutT (NUDIX family)